MMLIFVMNIDIVNDQNLHKVKNELVVVIDVLRAFTTACYAMNNNPKDYIVVGHLSSARKLKKENPDYVLMGERGGLKLPGFDYGNSPSEIKNVDFSGKTIIHTTALGTRGIVNAFKCTKEVITGSFANAGAIINYIQKEKPNFIYLFPTDYVADDDEDLLFAKYIKGYFEQIPMDMNIIRKKLIKKHRSGSGYLIDPRTNYSKSDFHLALELDEFNFVLKAYLGKDKRIHLKRIDLE
jgi:2-phosphosulfolactate phosphatase